MFSDQSFVDYRQYRHEIEYLQKRYESLHPKNALSKPFFISNWLVVYVERVLNHPYLSSLSPSYVSTILLVLSSVVCYVEGTYSCMCTNLNTKLWIKVPFKSWKMEKLNIYDPYSMNSGTSQWTSYLKMSKNFLQVLSLIFSFAHFALNLVIISLPAFPLSAMTLYQLSTW